LNSFAFLHAKRGWGVVSDCLYSELHQSKRFNGFGWEATMSVEALAYSAFAPKNCRVGKTVGPQHPAWSPI